MINLWNKIFNLYNYLESKIAFYPTIITLGGILFTLFMYYLEANHQASEWVISVLPQLEIKKADTAQTLLGTIIGGLISLMVFSFSMVMVVLNQASSNFSPRLLPGLISNKNHQYVLGFYLATIIYCILIFLSVESGQDSNNLPVCSICMGIFFTICCLGLFIYFIHSISQAIQVNNISKNIYCVAAEKLKQLAANSKEEFTGFDNTNAFIYRATRVGYYNKVNYKALEKVLKNKPELNIFVTVVRGQFVQLNTCLFKTNVDIDTEIAEEIAACFQYTEGEIITENYVLAYKQLTEIAVKAMSPGINDPGTAILCLDYLTALLKLRLPLADAPDVVRLGNQYLMENKVSFKEIISTIFAELRNYCTHDVVITRKMIETLNYLNEQPHYSKQYKAIITQEKTLVQEDAQECMRNSKDIAGIAI